MPLFPNRGHRHSLVYQGTFGPSQIASVPSQPQVVPPIMGNHPMFGWDGHRSLPIPVGPLPTESMNRALNYSFARNPNSNVRYNGVGLGQVGQERGQQTVMSISSRPLNSSNLSSGYVRFDPYLRQGTATFATTSAIGRAHSQSAEELRRRNHNPATGPDTCQRVISSAQHTSRSYDGISSKARTSEDSSHYEYKGEHSGKIKRSTIYRKKQDQAWDAMFEELRLYKNITGTCLVPGGSKPHQKLGRWVNWQRNQRDKISDHRKRRLEEIGFCWNKTCFANAWDDMFERLVAYWSEHGDCDIPQKYSEDPKLGLWVSSQRVNRDHMSTERKERLNSIGFIWKKFVRKKAN